MSPPPLPCAAHQSPPPLPCAAHQLPAARAPGDGIGRQNLSTEPDSVYRGAEPDLFLSRRFFNLGGSFFRVRATTACFMSTQDLGESIRSNHSRLPSSGAMTTDPWQIF
jgi:hypothetical protein